MYMTCLMRYLQLFLFIHFEIPYALILLPTSHNASTRVKWQFYQYQTKDSQFQLVSKASSSDSSLQNLCSFEVLEHPFEGNKTGLSNDSHLHVGSDPYFVMLRLFILKSQREILSLQKTAPSISLCRIIPSFKYMSASCRNDKSKGALSQ